MLDNTNAKLIWIDNTLCGLEFATPLNISNAALGEMVSKLAHLGVS